MGSIPFRIEVVRIGSIVVGDRRICCFLRDVCRNHKPGRRRVDAEVDHGLVVCANSTGGHVHGDPVAETVVATIWICGSSAGCNAVFMRLRRVVLDLACLLVDQQELVTLGASIGNAGCVIAAIIIAEVVPQVEGTDRDLVGWSRLAEPACRLGDV